MSTPHIDPAMMAQLDALIEMMPHDEADLKPMLVSLLGILATTDDRQDRNIIKHSLRELLAAFQVFAPYRDVRKVAIFGSARTPETHPAYQLTEAFAWLITQKGYMVITGAGGGIMEAGNRGAQVNMSFGANIMLPFEQSPNPYIDTSSKLVSFKYFFNRKLMFIRESDATVLCPGGFGTHDEAFEVLTLVQTGRCAPRPVVLLAPEGDSYWDRWIDFVNSELLGQHYISDDDLFLWRPLHSAQEAVDHIVRFYRRYHSIRYHDDLTIIRLNSPLSPEALRDMTTKFKSLLVKGEIEQVMPHELGFDQDAYPELPRLLIYYNRSTFGRLYQVIDYLNHVSDHP